MQGKHPVPRNPPKRYDGPTYYGLPPVKPSKYHALVWTYTWVAGLAGGAQLLAGVARLLSRRRPELESVVRQGRGLAMTGVAVGPMLLIADLHTPQRWYNMLRIFRKTSPMSIGSYLLCGFGLSSLAAWLGNRGGVLARVGDAAQAPASVAGAGMGVYTAALIAATSTPLWSAAPRLLAARFACSAVAGAAAALSLGQRLAGKPQNARPLDRIAAGATAAEMVVGHWQEREYARQGVEGPLHDGQSAAREYHASQVLGHALPLALYGIGALGRRAPRAVPVLAAVGVVAGGLLMRSSLFKAGNASAARAHDYFGLTQAPQAERQLEGTGTPLGLAQSAPRTAAWRLPAQADALGQGSDHG